MHEWLHIFFFNVTLQNIYIYHEKNSILLVSGFQHYNLQGANHHVEWIVVIQWCP